MSQPIPVAAAPDFDPTQPSQQHPADNRSAGASRKRGLAFKRALIAAAVLCLAAAGWIAWQRHGAPKLSPLEPTPAIAKVPVPLPSEMVQTQAPKASGPASLSSQSKSLDPVTADAVDELMGSTSTSTLASGASDAGAMLRTALNALTGRTDTLEAAERANALQVQEHASQIADLRKEIDLLKTSAPRAMAARAGGSRQAAAKPAAKPASATAAPAADASVLAVDLWAGKASVAVSRTDPTAGTELRFLNEGESHGRVTFKRADIAAQNATFVTPDGERTFAARER